VFRGIAVPLVTFALSITSFSLLALRTLYGIEDVFADRFASKSEATLHFPCCRVVLYCEWLSSKPREDDGSVFLGWWLDSHLI
jgi:hypothetical protein